MHMWPGHTCDCWKWPICKDNDVDVVQFLSVFYFSYVCPLSREKNERSYNVWNDVGWGRALDSFYCKSSRFKNNILEYSVCLSITYPIQSVFIGSIIYALLPTCDPYVHLALFNFSNDFFHSVTFYPSSYDFLRQSVSFFWFFLRALAVKLKCSLPDCWWRERGRNWAPGVY